MKPFKTHRQQLAILRSRKLIINDGSRALRVLEKENYYNVINGYKKFFLLLDIDGKPVVPEEYKPGATFDELYKLFTLDRELRNCLLESLLIFETNLKTKIAYRFSEKHSDSHAYLIHKNYSRDPKKLTSVIGLISTLSSTIKRKVDSKNIGHYLDNHDGVPLWVLINLLTLGNVDYMYKCFTDPLRNKIAKDFAIQFKQEYGQNIHFTSEMLDAIIKTSNYFRNICAHEERLYNFNLKKPAKVADISSAISISISEINKGNLFSMIAFMKLVLTKKEYKALLKKTTHIIKSYGADFSAASFNDILLEMGFGSNWEQLLSQ